MKTHKPLYSILGPGVFYTLAAAKKILNASQNVPFFHLEDVYITGLVYRQHLGLKLTDLPGSIDNPNTAFDACKFRKDYSFQMLHSRLSMKSAWESYLATENLAHCRPRP